MSELLRFRLAHSPQRSCIDPDQYIELYLNNELSELVGNTTKQLSASA